MMAMTPDALSTLAHAALTSPSPLEHYRPQPSRRAAYGTTTLVSEGDAGPDFNHAAVLGPTTLETLFALAAAFFAPDVDYNIIVDAMTAPGVGDLLRAHGWTLDEEEPALVLSPLPVKTPSPPLDLDIRRVVDAAGLDDFRGVSETPSFYLPSIAAVLDEKIVLLVGYSGGDAGATARLTCLGLAAEINGVVVAPHQRRRGYGTALTWAAIAAGRTRGCTTAVLTATPMGYPLYLGMGFELAGLYHTYLSPTQMPHDAR